MATNNSIPTPQIADQRTEPLTETVQPRDSAPDAGRHESREDPTLTITTAAHGGATTADISALFQAQQVRFASDATKSLKWRLDQLTRLERLIAEKQDALGTALNADFKAAVWDVTIEFGISLGAIAEARANLGAWIQPTEAELPATFASKGYRARVFHDPYGVTLLIAPLVAILAAGNPAIVKPRR
ncbi:hypothetical protein ACL9RL_18270 [Plantibacter sp. Mn2098]|uniref:hypothetical protein n=1 Tax=Plantibacter sp. Mn2098 TaxID=3395266 RepID=UPI003BD633D4